MKLNKEWIVQFSGKTRINGDCIEFTRAKCPQGYGRVWYKNKIWLSHRLSYRLSFGKFDEALFVCHHCDNPACINPDHLFLGTNRDNLDDMLRKGRSQKCQGELHSQRKLTEEEIVSIRKDERIYRLIAAEYGIAEAYVSRIKSKQTWPHVESESVKIGYAVGERNAGAVLTESDIRQIRSDPRSNTDIANDFGVTRQNIRRIKLRETWKHVD